MKKNFIVTAVVAFVVALTLALSGCSAIGLSAYDLAVRNGFEGTEKEWLVSLKGASGEDGKDGVNFNVGYTAYSLYEEMLDSGEFEGSFADFVKEYFGGEDYETVAHNTLVSVCKVMASFTVVQRDMFGRYYESEATSSGSGVFYSVDSEVGDALIITNYHVVYSESEKNDDKLAEKLYIAVYGKEYTDYLVECEFVGGSSTYDIALLKVSDSEIIRQASLRAVEFADSDAARVGEAVIATGNSNGKGLAVTKGVLSVDSEVISMTDGDYRVMRFDAAINPGNSGGGLFNKEGKLLGIVNAKNIEQNVDGMYYALTSNQVKGVILNLVRYSLGSKKSLSLPKIGLTTAINDSSAYYDASTQKYGVKEKVVVKSVSKGGAAEGKLVEGDRLISASIGGVKKNITRSFSLGDFVMTAAVGDVLVIEYERDGAVATTQIQITESCFETVA